MFDFFKLAQHLWDKDSPNFENNEIWKSPSKDEGGRTLYKLMGYKGRYFMRAYWNEELKELEISGSPMYYLKGHNYSCLNKEFFEVIDHLCAILNTDLWEAEVKEFEWGRIVQVDEPAKDYVQHHRSEDKGLKINHCDSYEGHMLRWEDKKARLSLKLYDPKRNYKGKLRTSAKQSLLEEGWEPNAEYVKFEAHYNYPERFNNGKVITLQELNTHQMRAELDKDLLTQYNRLTPMHTLITPKDKHLRTTANFWAEVGIEAYISMGLTIADIQKALYEKINRESCLNKSDRDSRKRQVKKELSLIKEDNNSKWSIENKLTGQMRAEGTLE